VSSIDTVDVSNIHAAFIVASYSAAINVASFLMQSKAAASAAIDVGSAATDIASAANDVVRTAVDVASATMDVAGATIDVDRV
jgi:hypothetical protein